MKKNSKKNSPNVSALLSFQKFEMPAKQLTKIKGGNDFIGVEDLIDG